MKCLLIDEKNTTTSVEFSFFSELSFNRYSLVLLKEVARLKQRVPFCFIRKDVLTDLVASLDLVHHNAACRIGHVVGRVLLRISRRDDRHQVVFVLRIILETNEIKMDR